MDTNKSESYSNKDFKDALLELKTTHGMSYMAIAVKAGLSDSYLVNIVNGKNLAPTDENIAKIAAAFDVGPEYFKEYRNRRLSERMANIDFHMDNYDVPLSPEEIAYLKKIIEAAERQ